jgi:HK97 family phage major capsid protein
MSKELLAERLTVWERMKEIHERAAGREMSAEESAEWTRDSATLDSLDARMQQAAEFATREARADAAREQFEKITRDAPAAPAAPAAENPDELALRALVRGERRSVEFNPTARGIQNRDLTVGTTTAGGFTFGKSFYDQLVQHMVVNAGILDAGATVIRTAAGEDLLVPKTTGRSTAAIISEAGTVTESDPAFGQVTLGAFKYGFTTQVSRELIDDTAVDLIGFLSMQGGAALGNGFGAHAMTGTGSGQPTGLVVGSTLGKTGATGAVGVPTADELIDLFFSVTAPYRNSSACAWMMRDATLAAVRKLKASGTGEYLWTPAASVGAPDTILAKRVVTDPTIAATALSAKSVIFGDISKYFVRMAGAVRVERSDDFAFQSDLATFKYIARMDGQLVDTTGAVKHYIGGAT